MKSGKRCIKETIFVRISLAPNIPSSPLPFPYTLVDTYVRVCACVCTYVCRRLQGKREGWALYCCFLFYWDKFIVGLIHTPLCQRDKRTVQPVFIFLRFSLFFSGYYFFFFFIATSKAIPNYPSLNIQRMGRKGNEMGEVYYVISFSKEIWKICLFPASWYSGVYVVVSNRYFLIKFHVSHSLIKRRIFPLIFEES